MPAKSRGGHTPSKPLCKPRSNRESRASREPVPRARESRARTSRPTERLDEEMTFGQFCRSFCMLACVVAIAWLAFNGKLLPLVSQKLHAIKDTLAQKLDSQDIGKLLPSTPEVHASPSSPNDGPPSLNIMPPPVAFPSLATETDTMMPINGATEPAGTSEVSSRAGSLPPLSVRVPPSAYAARGASESFDASLPPLPDAGRDGQLSPLVVSAAGGAQAQIEDRERILQQLGAVYYRLDAGGQGADAYRFYCQVAVDPAGQLTLHFEDTGSDPVSAIDGVVRQVSEWKQRRGLLQR